jgi:hypothetical protein
LDFSRRYRKLLFCKNLIPPACLINQPAVEIR